MEIDVITKLNFGARVHHGTRKQWANYGSRNEYDNNNFQLKVDIPYFHRDLRLKTLLSVQPI